MKLFPAASQKSLSKPRKVFLSGMAIVMAATFGYQFWKTRSVTDADPSASAPDARLVLTEAVGRHMLLPESLLSVTQIGDPSFLRQANSNFYANAETGDWVLRYPSQVILYRATSDEVVRVMRVRN